MGFDVPMHHIGRVNEIHGAQEVIENSDNMLLIYFDPKLIQHLVKIELALFHHHEKVLEFAVINECLVFSVTVFSLIQNAFWKNDVINFWHKFEILV